jgi:hypothetical protein
VPAKHEVPEVKRSCQDMSLDASSFIRDARSKSIVTQTPIDIDSFNISPIKDKSHKYEKSTICDRSSLQAILNEEVRSTLSAKNIRDLLIYEAA